ncbi:hypothetical protein Rhe02_98740 [Rhizocola hellebori]|uniref:Uncharacterized protein n=1 Tax=Rhizocola hellebori TaxID=1392758 RepID=A0A8J3QKL2_9ACTN|nr:hypothetical protein Rhe02_98740 [Rhizocola hellebori]
MLLEMRKAARLSNVELPGDDSLRRMVREWSAGRRGLSEFYAGLLSSVFTTEFAAGAASEPSDAFITAQVEGLEMRLSAASKVDVTTVALLEQQTEVLRGLDRRLGAMHLLKQTQQHVVQLSDLLAFSMRGETRRLLGIATAEAAALAGWQALDLGDTAESWKLHEVAKSAARDAGNAAVLAHVSAQQAYALLDAEKTAEAVECMRAARRQAQGQVPALLESWLWAAEAEALAALGDAKAARHALDQAASKLQAEAPNADMPFIFLDATHLGRWRGHCLARLGAAEAVEELTASLDRMDSSFARAVAGLRTDLAMAHAVRGEHDEARHQAGLALELANQTASNRQRKRLSRLLASGLQLAR